MMGGMASRQTMRVTKLACSTLESCKKCRRKVTEKWNRRLHQQQNASLETNLVRDACRQAKRMQRSAALRLAAV